MGQTDFLDDRGGAFTLRTRSSRPVTAQDGKVSADRQVFGTYMHGIFDNDELRRAVLNELRKRKHLDPLPVSFRWNEYKDSEYNRLADTVRQALHMDLIYRLLQTEPSANV